MTQVDQVPSYNLKVVVQETGVKPDTLRAWERRYGLPEPERTVGRHRLYSQYDIEVIRWLVARQEEGLSISRSVKLWHSLIEAGQNPLEEYAASPSSNEDDDARLGRRSLDEIREAWIGSCLDFNEGKAEQVLTQAFALYPPVLVCVEVLQRGLAELGSLWYENEISVQQEHFASALAMRRLNALVAAAPLPTRSERLIIGCPAEEDHIFAPLMLTLMLRYNGWPVVYLGANVPINRLETMMRSVAPDLIIMTAQQLHTAANLRQVAEFAAKENVPMAFGGRIFSYIPQLRAQIPGYYLGDQLEGAVRNVSNLLSGALPLPEVEPIPESYLRALGVYHQRQAAVENDVWQILQKTGMPYEHVVNANHHLSRDIIASLRLGDMTLLGREISWTEKLLLNYNMPETALHDYLEAYFTAVQQQLGEEGRPVIGWLEGVSRS